MNATNGWPENAKAVWAELHRFSQGLDATREQVTTLALVVARVETKLDTLIGLEPRMRAVETQLARVGVKVAVIAAALAAGTTGVFQWLAR